MKGAPLHLHVSLDKSNWQPPSGWEDLARPIPQRNMYCFYPDPSLQLLPRHLLKQSKARGCGRRGHAGRRSAGEDFTSQWAIESVIRIRLVKSCAGWRSWTIWILKAGYVASTDQSQRRNATNRHRHTYIQTYIHTIDTHTHIHTHTHTPWPSKYNPHVLGVYGPRALLGSLTSP